MNCPECGTPYENEPDNEGIRDCTVCGVWTLPVFWEIRNDTDYTAIQHDSDPDFPNAGPGMVSPD